MRGVIATSRRAVVAAVLVAVAAGCATGPAGVTHGRKPAVAAHARTGHAAAHAPELPGLYLGAMAGPWYGPSVRPRLLFLGADWAIRYLRWTSWSQRRADGHGFEDGCMGPAGRPPCDKFWATITATDVRQHDGSRYFAVMKLTSRSGHVEWLVMNTKFGWWDQRARP